mgnify:CR=1 FL=1
MGDNQQCECTDECLGYLTKECKGIESKKEYNYIGECKGNTDTSFAVIHLILHCLYYMQFTVK